MGLYDDIPPPAFGGVAQSEDKNEREGKIEEGESDVKTDGVSAQSSSLYDGLEEEGEEVKKTAEEREGPSDAQPLRLNVKFLSRPKSSKKTPELSQPLQEDVEKPSLMPPSLLQRAVKRPRQASPANVKRQRREEGSKSQTRATPVVHRAAVLQVNIGKRAVEIVEDEYDPLLPSTYAEYLEEKKKRAAMELQEEHDRAALLAMAKNTKGSSLLAFSEQEVDEDGDIVMDEDEEDTGSRGKAPKGNIAAKLMKKMGWKEGQGLGRDGSGMVKPLEAKRTADGSGLIVDPDADEHAAHMASDSPVLLLENMVESMADADAELQEEVKVECERIGGEVEQLLVTADMKNNPRIFVVFKELSAANAVLENFNGRFFGGRQVAVRHYSQQQFSRRQYIL